MSAHRTATTLGLALALLMAACSSSEEPPAVIDTNPPLTTVAPLVDPPPSATAPPSVPTTIGGTNSTLSPGTAPPNDEPKLGVEKFVPTLQLEDDRLILNAVFVDGTTAVVSWPDDLDLVGEGLVPYGWAFIAGGSSRDFFIRPGRIEDVLDLLGGAELLGEYPDGNGATVGYWRPQDDEVDYLGFEFGNWTVLVFEYREPALQMSDEHRAVWASGFHGTETEDGFLVLSADRPLQLVYAGSFPTPINLTMRGAEGEVQLTPGPCEAGTTSSPVGEVFATWCTQNGRMTVQVYGSPQFQQAVKDGLRVGTVEIAEPPPPPEDDEG